MAIILYLTFACAVNAVHSLENGPFSSLTPHSALCISEYFALSRNLSNAASQKGRDKHILDPNLLTFLIRTIFPQISPPVLGNAPSARTQYSIGVRYSIPDL